MPICEVHFHKKLVRGITNPGIPAKAYCEGDPSDIFVWNHSWSFLRRAAQ